VTLPDDLPVIPFDSADAWEAWLSEHHESSPGVWLKFAKRDSGIDSVRYPEAVEAALAHGWIDGQARRLDDEWYVQRFTPRTARSRWSRINRDKAIALIERGAMKPAGLAEVERAKADGRWDAAYASPRAAKVPDDLQRALDAHPAAREFFSGLDGNNRYAILHRIEEAKRPDTRARRIAKFVAMLEAGEKIHPG
jgi:uncharacterized protein YdeI (YjbR/CyaY-like superfamily)